MKASETQHSLPVYLKKGSSTLKSSYLGNLAGLDGATAPQGTPLKKKKTAPEVPPCSCQKVCLSSALCIVKDLKVERTQHDSCWSTSPPPLTTLYCSWLIPFFNCKKIYSSFIVLFRYTSLLVKFVLIGPLWGLVDYYGIYFWLLILRGIVYLPCQGNLVLGSRAGT